MSLVGGLGPSPHSEKRSTSDTDLKEAIGGLYLSDDRPQGLRTLRDLLERKEFIEHLKRAKTNTFFFRRAGQHLPLLDVLRDKVGALGVSVREVRTLANLTKRSRQSAKNSEMRTEEVLLIIPTMASYDDMSQMVAKALAPENHPPIWLAAFPSCINKQLLAAFDNFFLVVGSNSEISVFQDVLGPKVLDTLKDAKQSIILVTTYKDNDVKPGEPIELIFEL